MSFEAKWLYNLTRPFTRPLIFIVLLQAILSLSSVSIAIVSKMMIDAAVSGIIHKAILASVIFACLILLQIGLRAISSIISSRTNGLIINKLQQNIYQSLTQTKWSDYTKYHSEDLMTRFTNDAQLITDSIISVFPNIIALGVELVAAFVVLFIFDHTLALLAFCLGPLALLFNRFFGKRLKMIHIKMQESESSCRESMHESIQNMLVVKTFCLEDSSLEQIRKLQEERLSLVIRRSQMSIAARSMLSLGYWIGYFLAFNWGAYRLYNRTGTFGTMTAFLQLVGQVQGPVVGLAFSYPQIITTLASTGRIMEIQSLPNEDTTNITPVMTTAGIEFRQVNFSYKDDIPILENISLTILSGEIVALVGPSGIGKTTFIQLLLALLYPKSGHVYILGDDGNKIDINSTTRSLISYVPQGNTLFSGTIEENIRVGNQKATMQEVESAIRLSDAWGFIEKLPEGLQTKIGEKGFGLSEGQDQRIAIARAILRKSPILILDEATSALDIDSEKKILETIRNLIPARTCIIITHRNTALSLCNRVFKIEEGQIIESHE
jgi:ATP-binding cassette subfamily B protein